MHEVINIIKNLASSGPITGKNKSINLAFHNRALGSQESRQENMRCWFNLNILQIFHIWRAVCEERNSERSPVCPQESTSFARKP